MRNNSYYLLAFNSTNDAMAAENYLSDKIQISIMPTLRKISVSCGISIRIEQSDVHMLKEILCCNEKIKNSCVPYFIDGDNITRINI